MSTKEQAFQNARYTKSREPHKPVYVYRVGAAWMYTTQEFVAVQAKYKRPISQWFEVDKVNPSS